MKKIIVFLLGVILMSSCYGPYNHDRNKGSDVIIVLKIQIQEDADYSWYKIGVDAYSNFDDYKTFWFKDDISKYEVGDTINNK